MTKLCAAQLAIDASDEDASQRDSPTDASSDAFGPELLSLGARYSTINGAFCRRWRVFATAVAALWASATSKRAPP
jgi:hypothetical protein